MSIEKGFLGTMEKDCGSRINTELTIDSEI